MNIKLVITDIDGVWTDSGMYYDETGNELKKYSTYDSAGILLLKHLGIKTAIISGEISKGLERRGNKLGIDYLFLGISDKVLVSKKLIKELKIDFSEVAFIGDDLNDLELLRIVGLSATPINGHKIIKKYVDHIISTRGGEGAFRAFVEEIVLADKNLEDLYSEIFNKKNKNFVQ